MGAWVCRQPETVAVRGLTHCFCFNSETHCCSFKWFAEVWSMERARGPCLEPRMVLILSWERPTGPKKSSGNASPCRSELCCCNILAWGLRPSFLSPTDVSGSSTDGVHSLLELSFTALTLVPDKSQRWLSGFFNLFTYLFYTLTP